MRIDAGLDTGDILLQREIPIEPSDTAETLGPRLASMGADLMVETLRGLESGLVRPAPQDDSLATLLFDVAGIAVIAFSVFFCAGITGAMEATSPMLEILV